MKKWVALCLGIILLFSAGECVHAAMKRSAGVDRAKITIEDSEDYSEREIRAAMKVVKRRFKWNYRSTLLSTESALVMVAAEPSAYTATLRMPRWFGSEVYRSRVRLEV